VVCESLQESELERKRREEEEERLRIQRVCDGLACDVLYACYDA